MLTLSTPSDAINLGNRTRSRSCWSKTVVVFLIPSVEAETKSITPTTGLVKSLMISQMITQRQNLD